MFIVRIYTSECLCYSSSKLTIIMISELIMTRTVLTSWYSMTYESLQGLPVNYTIFLNKVAKSVSAMEKKPTQYLLSSYICLPSGHNYCTHLLYNNITDRTSWTLKEKTDCLTNRALHFVLIMSIQSYWCLSLSEINIHEIIMCP
jgi:hypothetical protein